MKTLLLATVWLAGAWLLGAAESFQQATLGILPPQWDAGITGAGTPKWTVEPEASGSTNRVLKQSGIVERPCFPLCVRREPVLRDGFVAVRFKTLSGEIDQAAGVMWRVQDTNNYYICRANALEDNVVLYKVHEGKRITLPVVGRAEGYGVQHKVKPGEWRALRVEFAGARFKVVFDGRLLFEVEDQTFTQPGRLGLWTKADSVTLFDDFEWGGP